MAEAKQAVELNCSASVPAGEAREQALESRVFDAKLLETLLHLNSAPGGLRIGTGYRCSQLSSSGESLIQQASFTPCSSWQTEHSLSGTGTSPLSADGQFQGSDCTPTGCTGGLPATPSCSTSAQCASLLASQLSLPLPGRSLSLDRHRGCKVHRGVLGEEKRVHGGLLKHGPSRSTSMSSYLAPSSMPSSTCSTPSTRSAMASMATADRRTIATLAAAADVRSLGVELPQAAPAAGTAINPSATTFGAAGLPHAGWPAASGTAQLAPLPESGLLLACGHGFSLPPGPAPGSEQHPGPAPGSEPPLAGSTQGQAASFSEWTDSPAGRPSEAAVAGPQGQPPAMLPAEQAEPDGADTAEVHSDLPAAAAAPAAPPTAATCAVPATSPSSVQGVLPDFPVASAAAAPALRRTCFQAVHAPRRSQVQDIPPPGRPPALPMLRAARSQPLSTSRDSLPRMRPSRSQPLITARMQLQQAVSATHAALAAALFARGSSNSAAQQQNGPACSSVALHVLPSTPSLGMVYKVRPVLPSPSSSPTCANSAFPCSSTSLPLPATSSARLADSLQPGPGSLGTRG